MRTTQQHNLPASHRSLIGREEDIVEVRDLVIRARGRLVTLTGTGGCGKTQLALKVAADLVDTFDHGVWFVDLAPVRVPRLVGYAVAAALGRDVHTGQAIEDALVEYLAHRDVLLVLDNCEHLVDACAGLAERLLSGCPRIRLLATSRERLRIAGETTWRVSSLARPDARMALTPTELLAYPAVQLFVERALAVQADFVLGPANAASVAALCARLEGLPLALELAAARLPALALPEILERLDQSLRLLVGGSRTDPTRQQTLQATLDWSHDLLSPAEQLVFRRLAVFASGWTLEAAEAVCADAAIAGSDVLEFLAHLIDKSLVLAGERDGRSRYRLLESIRQYAWDQLAASDELDRVRQRHATFFLAFAEGLGRGASASGARRSSAVQALKGEYRNLQVALQWALDARDADVGLRLAWTLEFVWKFRLVADDGRLWIEQLLRLPGADAPTPARAVALLTAAWLRWSRDRHAGDAIYAEALPLARRLGDPWILFVALADKGLLAMHRGDYSAAHAYWGEGLTITQASGDRASEAVLLHNLGRLAIVEREYAAGRARCEEALRLARELGDYWTKALALEALRMAALALGELAIARALATECISLYSGAPYPTANALRALAQIDIAEGRYADARQQLGRSLAIGRDSAVPAVLAGVVDTFAGLAAQLGQPEVALRLAAAAEAAWEALGEVDFPFNRDLRDRWLVPLRARLRSDDVHCWWSEGRSLDLNEAIGLAEMALADTQPGSLPHSARGPVGVLTPRQTDELPSVAGLTSREVEVLRLVARGQSNKEIAAQLVLSVRTIERHITNLYSKIDARGKADATAYAIRHGLV
jgi:predicted ATPase/DNA-binding CsgD family transcriptional regulator